MANILRHEAAWDDIQCSVASTTGVSALGTITIQDTAFKIPCFQNANDDEAYCTFQMPHRKKLGTNLASVHLHYYLPSAPANGNTLKFLVYYTWFNSDASTVPAIGSWLSPTPNPTVVTFAGTEAAYSTGYVALATNLTCPATEEYSSILLVKVIRDSTGGTADTYDDDLGILYIDAHFETDRAGSSSEGTD